VPVLANKTPYDYNRFAGRVNHSATSEWNSSAIELHQAMPRLEPASIEPKAALGLGTNE
jgi:hypothetical protein